MGATAPFTQVTHEAAAEALTLRQDTIHLIDAGSGNEDATDRKEGPSSESNPK